MQAARRGGRPVAYAECSSRDGRGVEQAFYALTRDVHHEARERAGPSTDSRRVEPAAPADRTTRCRGCAVM